MRILEGAVIAASGAGGQLEREDAAGEAGPGRSGSSARTGARSDAGTAASVACATAAPPFTSRAGTMRAAAINNAVAASPIGATRRTLEMGAKVPSLAAGITTVGRRLSGCDAAGWRPDMSATRPERNGVAKTAR